MVDLVHDKIATENLKKIKDGNELIILHKFQSNEYDLWVERTAYYEGEMTKELALTSFTLRDACRSFAPRSQ